MITQIQELVASGLMGKPIDLAEALDWCQEVLNLVKVLDYGEGPIRSRVLDQLQQAMKDIDGQWEMVEDGDEWKL